VQAVPEEAPEDPGLSLFSNTLDPRRDTALHQPIGDLVNRFLVADTREKTVRMLFSAY